MYSSSKLSYKLVVSTLVVSMLFQSFEAVARVGGGARSSMGSSHSMSNYGNPSQRVGGGNNAGMQRPDVMNNVRQEPAVPNNTAMPPPNNLSNAQPQTKPGYGLGTVVGAAAAGAAVGYIANSAMHNNNQVVQAGSSATGQFEDPLSAKNTVDRGFSFSGILMFLLGVAAIVGILIMMTRRRELAGNVARYSPNISAKTMQSPATDFAAGTTSGSILQNQQQDFERNALTFFNDLQTANNRADVAFMQERTTEPLQSALIYDIQNRENPSRTKVVMMDASLVDMTKEQNQQIASVRFRGMVSENENSTPEQVDEVWHFVQNAAQDWKLAGIEQV